MLNLRLETAGGDAFVEKEEIVYVSAPYKKGNYKPSRTVGLRSGHSLYILDTKGNVQTLRDSGIGADIPQDKPKLKGRKTNAAS